MTILIYVEYNNYIVYSPTVMIFFLIFRLKKILLTKNSIPKITHFLPGDINSQFFRIHVVFKHFAS